VSGFPGSAGKHRAISAIPGFPGAQMIGPALCSRDNFHANACSLAPLPTTRIFIYVRGNYSTDKDLEKKILRETREGDTREGSRTISLT
jgi:hypothetical protein